MKIGYNFLHSFTLLIVLILFVPTMCIVGGIVQFDIWLFIGGLSSGYFILFLMKNMVLSISGSIKVFNIRRGFFELNYTDLLRVHFPINGDSYDYDGHFYFLEKGKEKCIEKVCIS